MLFRSFRFTRSDLSEYAPLSAHEPAAVTAPLDEKLRGVCKKASGLAICGIDVGGTDIKLALSLDGSLVRSKEYDWNPASYQTAEEIIEPILWLTRLMRVSLHGAARRGVSAGIEEAIDAAFKKDVPLAQIRRTVEAAEAVYVADR